MSDTTSRSRSRLVGVVAVAVLMAAGSSLLTAESIRADRDRKTKDATTVFPATNNVQVARTYATAYIVGELIKKRGDKFSRKDVIDFTKQIYKSFE